MSNITTDPNLQTLRINDFSPGIVQFSRGAYPTTYSPHAPLGSAATAFGCINRQGVGLVPFPKSNGVFNVNPTTAPDVSTTVYCTGFGSMGPVVGSSSWSQAYDNMDWIFIALGYTAAATFRKNIQRINWDLGSAQSLNDVALTQTLYHHCPNFVVTRFLQNGFATAIPRPTMIWPGLQFSGVGYSPDVTQNVSPIPAGQEYSVSPVQPMHLMAHASRAIIAGAQSMQVATTGSTTLIESTEDFWVTDPPLSYTFDISNFNEFDPEHFSGLGVWGSIDSGELLIIHQGGGAILINGDARAPSGVTKLPGVVGPGKIMQRGVHTVAGLIYVTEWDGVYSWNGGNTSRKISNQIPDDACKRLELEPATGNPATPGFIGNLTTHDQINNWVFFANNWIYDCTSGSWWKSQDPSGTSYSVFSRSSHGRYMYCAPGTVISGSPIVVARFDMKTPQPSYTWISNPVPVSIDSLCSMEYVELVASNSDTSPATFTVTPTVPAGVTGLPNNPQSLTFTIPANSEAVRVGGRLGFQSHNIQLKVVANAFNNLHPAPTLHEIVVGYRTDATPVGATV